MEENNCTHDCSTCSENCGSRAEIQKLQPREGTKIKKVIAVISGKGGVGKSLVTSLLAVEMQRRGFRTAVLDADITGPSAPRAFGVHSRATSDGVALQPVKSKTGIELMSLNLLLENETDPVAWRGPIIAGVVQQFWTDVAWGEVDYMFVDMPPGTGDVTLTVFQSLPVDAAVIVTSPQDLVGMIVEKSVNMTRLMKVPVAAIAENFSYFTCPDCGAKHSIYGESHVEKTAAELGIKTAARLPIDPKYSAAFDEGAMELAITDPIAPIADAVEAL